MKIKKRRVLLLLINYYTAVYVIIAVLVIYHGGFTARELLIYLLIWIYIFPPLLCRLVIFLYGRPVGIVKANSALFMRWWFLTQLQMVFVRLPFLEEVLRIFPGIYSAWLNLWGARVSLFTYWSPAVTVTDRYLIHIDHGAVIGGGCRIGAHILMVDKNGEKYLTLAQVQIDKNSVIGIHAAIGPGCHVYPNETIPAGKILKPFFAWKDGKILRPVDLSPATQALGS